MGLLVICECDIETHGVAGQLSHDPAYAPFYVERAMRMVLNYKNHACILFVVAGQRERLDGPDHAATYGFIKEYDKTRICQYEAGNPEKNQSDIPLATCTAQYSEHTQNAGRHARHDRPIILVEYLYQIRSPAAAALSASWKLCDKYVALPGRLRVGLAGQGAAGPSARRYDLPGVRRRLWRKCCRKQPDHRRAAFHDQQRHSVLRPHVEAGRIRSQAGLRAHLDTQARAPVGLVIEIPEDEFEVVNRCQVRSTCAFSAAAYLRENGRIIAKQPFPLPDLKPLERANVRFSMPHERRAGCEYSLELSVTERSTGYEAARWHFDLSAGEAVMQPNRHPGAPLTVEESDEACLPYQGRRLRHGAEYSHRRADCAAQKR